jgi:hypothetical protein
MPDRHELGHLLEAGGRVDEGRVAGHRAGDPDIVDVLAVGYDVGDVGVGDDPGRSGRRGPPASSPLTSPSPAGFRPGGGRRWRPMVMGIGRVTIGGDDAVVAAALQYCGVVAAG